MLETNIKYNSKTAVELTIKVPYQDFKPSLDKVYSSISSNAKIPGFRKGKVPQKVIDNFYSKPAIVAQAVEEGSRGWIASAIEKEGIFPVFAGETTVKKTPINQGDTLELFATMEVVPEWELPKLNEITVKVDPIKIEEKEVDQRIEFLRERFASLEPVKTPAKNDNFVKMDLIAKDLNGKKLEEDLNVSYKVGTNSGLEGLDTAIIGLKEGEQKEFTTKLVGGKHNGVKVNATVTVKKVNIQKLPEANDDFAKLASEFDTLKELRASEKKLLEGYKKQNQVAQAKNKLMEVLVSVSDISVPEKFLENKINILTKEKKPDLSKLDELKTTESNRIKEEFIISKLVDKTKVSVSQEEVMQYFQIMGQQFGIPPQDLMEQTYKNGRLQDTMTGIAGNKALEYIVRDVTIKDTDGKSIVLEPIPTEPKDEIDKGAKTEQNSEIGKKAKADNKNQTKQKTNKVEMI